MAGCVLRVLAEERDGAEERDRKKDGSGDFEPQLVHSMAEGAGGGARATQDRAESAVASGLLVGNASDRTRLS